MGTATPLRRRLVMGGRAPLSPLTHGAMQSRAHPCLSPESPARVNVKDSIDSPMDSLFFATGAAGANFPSADVFTPVTKELAGGRACRARCTLLPGLSMTRRPLPRSTAPEPIQFCNWQSPLLLNSLTDPKKL